MKVSSIFAVLFISLVTGDETQTDEQPTEISTGTAGNNGTGNQNEVRYESVDEICNVAKDVSVQSAYVGEHFIQLFIENSDGSRGWTSEAGLMFGRAYPRYFAFPSRPDTLGQFRKIDQIRDSQKLPNDGQFRRISASFLHFSDSLKEKAYLVLGLNAYEFVIERSLYFPTGNVKPITDFFKESEKLLMPEDKFEEVVSVSLIKWVEINKTKDHEIYKIILKTVTKKLVKGYFKLTSKDEVISMNSEPFLPSAEVMQDENEFDLQEESALYYVRFVDTLSMGYQFSSKFAFPIYYEYDPEENTYIEYPMRLTNGFNSELEKLGDKVPYWHRFIVSSKTFLGCPDHNYCLGNSFDAVFFADSKYYALFNDGVYTLESITSTPGTRVQLTSLFSISTLSPINAAFTIGDMIFFIEDQGIEWITNLGDKNSETLWFENVFPGMDYYLVSAVIILDLENEPQKKLVYVFSNKNEGNVYQFEMETMKPPKFKLLANKTYNQVNVALPSQISLAFTAEGKVVMMFHHFMIEQSSESFFTQTENQAKFTLIDKYFGSQRENVEKKLTKEFVQKYIDFAGPKPGMNLLHYPTVAPKSTESTPDADVKGSGTKGQILIQCLMMQAAVMFIWFKFYSN